MIRFRKIKLTYILLTTFHTSNMHLLIIVLVCLLSVSSLGQMGGRPGTPGGWSPIPVDSDEALEHARYAVETKYPAWEVEFTVLGASTQVAICCYRLLRVIFSFF